MLDKKSISVLKALNKLASGTAYKVVSSNEIISLLTQKNLYDNDAIKEILDFLEKQEYLNIKFSEENTYCYSLLPKARIYLEQETSKTTVKKISLPIVTYVFVLIASFIGTSLAILLFFYLLV